MASILCVILLAYWARMVRCTIVNTSVEIEIRERLLDGYSSMTLPPHRPVNISIALVLNHLIDVDVPGETVHSNFLQFISWNDMRLAYEQWLNETGDTFLKPFCKRSYGRLIVSMMTVRFRDEKFPCEWNSLAVAAHLRILRVDNPEERGIPGFLREKMHCLLHKQ